MKNLKSLPRLGDKVTVIFKAGGTAYGEVITVNPKQKILHVNMQGVLPFNTLKFIQRLNGRYSTEDGNASLILGAHVDFK